MIASGCTWLLYPRVSTRGQTHSTHPWSAARRKGSVVDMLQ
jgi:hypothetical protein